MQFVPQAEAADAAVVQKAIALLKKDKMLGMVLSVETDAVFNQEQETEQVTKTTQTIIKMIADAFQVVSAQPALLPLYRQMIETVAATMPRSRPFEAVIEQCFAKVEVELNKPEPKPEPKPQVPTVEEQIKIQKMKNEYEIDKEKNLISLVKHV